MERPTVVLIVDEDEEFRRALVQVLAPRLPNNVQLRTARIPEEAFSLLDTASSRVLVIAASEFSKGMSGVEFLRRVHETDPACGRFMVMPTGKAGIIENAYPVVMQMHIRGPAVTAGSPLVRAIVSWCGVEESWPSAIEAP